MTTTTLGNLIDAQACHSRNLTSCVPRPVHHMSSTSNIFPCHANPRHIPPGDLATTLAPHYVRVLHLDPRPLRRHKQTCGTQKNQTVNHILLTLQHCGIYLYGLQKKEQFSYLIKQKCFLEPNSASCAPMHAHCHAHPLPFGGVRRNTFE